MALVELTKGQSFADVVLTIIASRQAVADWFRLVNAEKSARQ
jgi:hypothetical protein